MWRELLQAALELLYPAPGHCPLCNREMSNNKLCAICYQLLDDYKKERVCTLCGAFMGSQGKESQPLCMVCRDSNRSFPFSFARAVAPYEGPIKEAVHRLKYRGRPSLAGPLAQLMAHCAMQESFFMQADFLVPVPMHPERERVRGYNQSLLLARAAGEIMQKPVLDAALTKITPTSPQTGLTGVQRRQNLQGSFSFADSASEVLWGKSIILIDDVFTTGSTVSLLSEILRQSGAVEVQVLTFAGTRHNGH